MKNWMSYNLNQNVRVKLNEKGRLIHAQFFLRFKDYFPTPVLEIPVLEIDADGWTQFQLWELMEIFGAHLCIGGPTVFDSAEIQLEVEEQTVERDPRLTQRINTTFDQLERLSESDTRALNHHAMFETVLKNQIEIMRSLQEK